MDRRHFIKSLASIMATTALPKAVSVADMERTEIYILAGQSNMSGRGALVELPAFLNANRTRIFTNSWRWVTGYEPSDDPAGQLDQVSRDCAEDMASAAMSFADTMASLRVRSTIGLVPCAKGGSSISQWVKSASRDTLYGSMISRAKAASFYGEIKGLIWFQGEAEAMGGDRDIAGWSASFLRFAKDVREDLSAPNLKFVVTELGPCPDETKYPLWRDMQSQQRSLDGKLSGAVSCVSAADLNGKLNDAIHLDTPSLVVLGQRYAYAIDNLVPLS